MPLANLPMMLAVAGATSSSAADRGERDVLDVGVGAGLPLIDVITCAAGDGLEGERTDERRADAS